MTNNEIREQCETLSNEELYLIVTHKSRYTFQIVSIAQQEIKKRAIPKEEFKKLQKDRSRRSRIIEGDISEDLPATLKILFHYLFIAWPLRFIARKYHKEGYILKLHQSYYYMATGAVFPALAIGLDALHVSEYICMAIWFFGFPIAQLFNQFFYKNWLIRRLAARQALPDSN